MVGTVRKLPVRDGDETPVPDEKRRVQSFLTHVKAGAAAQEAQIEAAAARIGILEQELSTTTRALEARTRELERVRADYAAELRRRGEVGEALTAELLREKLASTLEEVRTDVAQSYQERLEQLTSTLADKQARTTQLDELVTSLRRDLEQAKTAATGEVQSLRTQLAGEREAFTTEVKKIRAQVTAQFMERIDQLEATLTEKDQLFVRADELAATLQAEIERVRTHATAEATTRDDKIALLTKQVKELERVVAGSEDMQRLKTLEREREELQRQCEAQDERVAALVAALTTLHEICTKSTAVRSIVCGTRKNLDLDALFSVLG